MKIICLKGGLGNQIFEYGRYLKIKESHQRAYIYYDKRRLKQHQNLMINDVFDITLPKEPLWVMCLVWICKILRHLKLFKTLYNDEKESAILIDDYSQSKEYAYLTSENLAFQHASKTILMLQHIWISSASLNILSHYTSEEATISSKKTRRTLDCARYPIIKRLRNIY